ncbi:MAG: L,D-transpeptidase [Clostridia bacterium]|nr:L,D-transpeptidase [Clostridia bacterium]
MKKFVGVMCVVIICCNSVLGNELLDANSGEVSKIDGLLQNQQLELVSQKKTLKEEMLMSFEDRESMTQGEAARIVCQYIGVSPIYLPEKENCKDPFIGRLVLEYIWGSLSYDEQQAMSLEEWKSVFNKAKQFKEDKNAFYNTLIAEKINIKEKINKYIEESYQGLTFKNISLGKAEQSRLFLSVHDKRYGLYEFLDATYINLRALEDIGFRNQDNMYWLEAIQQQDKPSYNESKPFTKKDVYIHNKPIYIGELRTYMLEIDHEMFVPIRALQAYFNLTLADENIQLVSKNKPISSYVLSGEAFIVNRTNEALSMGYSDLYWDGKQIIESQSEIRRLLPNEKAAHNTQLYSLKKGYYLTTNLHYIETADETLRLNQPLGQDMLPLLKKYKEALDNEYRESTVNKDVVFPPSLIIGTMKYAVNGFVKGQKVEVWAAEDGVSYSVKDSHGKVIKFPWNSIAIPKDPPTAKDRPTKEQIETFINEQDISSKTAYLVWTDLYRQQTYILKGSKNNWQLIKTLLCSTGRNITPTPRGHFELTNRVPYFGVDKGYRCKNAFQIFGDYLYHSIIFDVTGTRLLEGKGVLGHRASQGCIRFSEEESLWFYNTMQTGTSVWIH